MKLFVVLALMLINCVIENLAHAARVAGVRTQRLMLANSLFNLFLMGAGLAMGIQSPLVNNLVDVAVLHHAVAQVLWYCRLIITTRCLGYVLGMFLIPWFASVMEVGIAAMEKNGGLLFDALLEYASWRGLRTISRQFAVFNWRDLRAAWQQPYPRRVFYTATFVAAFYLAVEMAALYASALVPELPRTAIALSTALRGIGTILFVFLVDPFTAMIIDKAAARELALEHAMHITVWLSGGKALGAAGAQVLLVPMALIITELIA